MSFRSFYDICDQAKIAPTRLIAKTEALSDKYDLMQQDYRESRNPDERHSICVLAGMSLYRDLITSFDRISKSLIDCHRTTGAYPDVLEALKDLNGGNPIDAPSASLRMSTKSQDMIWIALMEETKGIFVKVTVFSRNWSEKDLVLVEPLGLKVVETIYKLFRNFNSRRPQKSEAQKREEWREVFNNAVRGDSEPNPWAERAEREFKSRSA